jgi:hypothetical protein
VPSRAIEPAPPRAIEPAPPRAIEPAPIMPPEPAHETAPAPDAALASMAQRLEAALRRPGAPEPRGAPFPAERPEAALDLPATEPTATAPDFTPGPRPEPKGAKPKSVLDSLEEEMASLLGRPPEKT